LYQFTLQLDASQTGLGSTFEAAAQVFEGNDAAGGHGSDQWRGRGTKRSHGGGGLGDSCFRFAAVLLEAAEELDGTVVVEVGVAAVPVEVAEGVLILGATGGDAAAEVVIFADLDGTAVLLLDGVHDAGEEGCFEGLGALEADVGGGGDFDYLELLAVGGFPGFEEAFADLVGEGWGFVADGFEDGGGGRDYGCGAAVGGGVLAAAEFAFRRAWACAFGGVASIGFGFSFGRGGLHGWFAPLGF